ncbi:hypothetical protein SQ03_03415 [Methylobacterium platani JCM 14648]|uniref:Uncharacterized protein n=3 Tax=Methylobacterium platani TaxID=427683 RepID=A0A179SHE7_9HYPH|nr:hypothetical protein SQ03_03415 [Methylobacterium platani JCM 14648]OAS26311.1 hypothetical protein A5481_06240 [Methylobacterium platani]
MPFDDKVFETYRATIDRRDLLRKEAGNLRESAQRLEEAGAVAQADLVRGRIGPLEEEADKADEHAEHLSASSGQNLARRLRSALKRELALAQADAAQARSFKELDAGLEFDRRTAGGSREIRIGNARGRADQRVTLASYSALIKDQAERTEARLRAMAAFDDLWHRAEKGLYPEPRFEPPVDTTAGPSGVTADRVDGLAEMQRLVAYVGRQAQAMLYLRIVERMEFTAIARLIGRDKRDVSALVLSAVDSAAAFFGYARPAPEIERLNEVLALP